jgi:2-oxoglutarate ferredoxin oxidoreductase subunit beta
MSYIAKPSAYHPALKKNALGLTHRDYEGAMTTLCAGCGHDSITAAIIEACFEMELPAHRIAKLSGIGCSSKAPTYFLGRSHGFNGVHGRMPSMATGANLANKDLVYIGVSGDGDTASIGLGQFCHAVRRHLNMVYVVMNNGCYGLTKGQFSATNDKASPSKKGEPNPFDAIDLCQIAIQLGAGFVARSFSGDKKQLIPLIKAAIGYRGFSFLDVISPCVTFNNHPTSTKSYDYVRDHNQVLGTIDYIEEKVEITADYAEGTSVPVAMHDGSCLVLHKLDPSYDPRDADAAIMTIRTSAAKGEVVTGLLYINESQGDLHSALGTADRPLNAIPVSELCPGSKKLEAINARLR